MACLFLLTLLWRCWLGGRKGIRPVKIWGDGGGGHWLVRMEWRPVGRSVCLPLLIFPCTTNSRSSLLAPAHPGGPGKRAVKRLWWWWCRLITTTTLQDCYADHKQKCCYFIDPVIITSVMFVLAVKTSGQRILMRGRIAEGIFNWENLMWCLTVSATSQSECWLTACWEIPKSGPLRMAFSSMRENPNVILLKIAPLHEGSGLQCNTWFPRPTESTSQFSHFCRRAYSCDWQTDRQTTLLSL